MQTYSTAHESSTDKQQRQEEIQPRNSSLQKAQALTSKNFFQTLMLFNKACCHDERLTPATQLVYRVLIDFGNAAFWSDTFKCSDDELMSITRLAKQTITDSKRRLKSLGYIDFSGKPTSYTIYSLLGNEPGNQLGQKADRFNTSIRKYNTYPKEEINKEERVIKHDNDNSEQDWRTSKEVTELLKNR